MIHIDSCTASLVAVAPLRVEESAEVLAAVFPAWDIPKPMWISAGRACSSLVTTSATTIREPFSFPVSPSRRFLTFNRPAVTRCLAQACLDVLRLDYLINRGSVKTSLLARYVVVYLVVHVESEIILLTYTLCRMILLARKENRERVRDDRRQFPSTALRVIWIPWPDTTHEFEASGRCKRRGPL